MKCNVLQRNIRKKYIRAEARKIKQKEYVSLRNRDNQKNYRNQLPKSLKRRNRFIIQINNSEDLSFYDSIHCLSDPFRSHKERPIQISLEDSLFNWDNVSFPTTIENIKIFEKNPRLLIYIWGYKEDPISPWYRFYMSDMYRENRFKWRTFQLLYYQNRYFPIVNPPAFYQFYYKPTGRKKIFPCLACRIYFYYTQEELEKHCLHCGDLDWEGEPETQLPSSGTVIRFKNHSKTLFHPFVLYLDGESCLEKIDKKIGEKTTQSQKHNPSTWGTLFVDHIKHTSEYNTFRSVEDLFSDIKSKLEYISSLHLLLDKKSKEKPTLCSYCQKPPTKNNPLVEDHNHFSGESRGFVHNECNLQRKDTYFLPIVAHNMMGYDSHFLIRHLKSINNTKRVQKDDGVKIIAENIEKFIYFEAKYQGKSGKIVTARFIDSLKFLDGSLDSLAKILPEDKFLFSAHYFKNPNLFQRKGFFPYSYVTDESILDSTLHPPSKTMFYDSFHEEHISDQDYQFVRQVWNEFQCENLRDYMERYYLKLDVTLLADIFEYFREWNIEEFQLDPIYYVSGPALSFDNALKFSNISLECITDPEIYSFFEEAKRGGYCGIHKRYAKANNPNLEHYDPNLPTTHFLFQDMNNLYGFPMLGELPVGNFKLQSPLENFDIFTCSDCYVECDISLPQQYHSKFKDFPLFPTREEDGKLKATLFPKKKYKVHSRYLRFGIKEGYQLDKIYRILTFDTKSWLSTYIWENTKATLRAKTKIENQLRKLMINSVYGKQIQDVRKEKDFYMVHYDNLLNYHRQERFYRSTSITKDLYLVQMKKKKVILDKPIYGGVAILDLSKLRMAEYFYSCLKPTFGDRYELVMTDTDSFLGLVQTENPYEELKPYISDWIDTTDLPLEQVNRMVPGKVKDELKGHSMDEFAGTRAKQYAFTLQGETIKKNKGNNKQATKSITFRYYKDRVLGKVRKPLYRNMNVFRARNRRLYTETIYKKVLDHEYDDKRQLLSNNIDTLPHGY